MAVQRKKKGIEPVHITCGRAGCNQLLSLSYGDFLDCFVFTVARPIHMRCETCGYETKWAPGEAVDAVRKSG